MRIVLALLAIAALASICIGAYWIYPPAGPIIGGTLVWIELIRSGSTKPPTPERKNK